MVIELALKLKYNDVASGLSGLPTCHLLPDLTQNISLCLFCFFPHFLSVSASLLFLCLYFFLSPGICLTTT